MLQKKINLFLIILAIFLSGCASTSAPSGVLIHPKNLQQDVFGGWIEIELESEQKYEGELLAVEPDSIFLIYNYKVAVLPKSDVKFAKLTKHEKQKREGSLGVLGGMVSGVSHGLFGIFSIPLWAALGSIAVGGHTHEAQMKYPRRDEWNSLYQFARYPQGIPDIDTSFIKPYNTVNLDK